MRKSQQFAFNSTMMRLPKEQELSYEQAKEYLSTSIVRYEINHHLANGEIKVFMH